METRTAEISGTGGFSVNHGGALARLAAAGFLALTLAACGAEETESGAATGAGDTTMTAQADVDQITTAAVEAPEPQGSVDMEAVLEPGPLEEAVLGEEDAPVTIVEYMSLTCPHCAAFHQNTFDPLKEKYIDTGKVRMIVRDFPFDPRAAAGAMLARCAPDGKYFPMISMLFDQQSNWAAAENAQAALLQLSRMAGFTQESFEACLTNQELLDDVNEVRRKAAEEFDVQSTPTFIINGQRYAGNMSIEQMSAIIDDQL